MKAARNQNRPADEFIVLIGKYGINTKSICQKYAADRREPLSNAAADLAKLTYILVQ